MKRSRIPGLCMVMLVTAIVFWAMTTNGAWAATMDGNFCWSLTITDSSGGGVGPVSDLKMHMKALDDYTFAAQGMINNPTDGPIVFGGTGRMGNPTIYLNLDMTKASNNGQSRESGVVRLKLSSTSYNGSFWYVGTNYDLTTHQFENNYTAGTMTKVACN